MSRKILAAEDLQPAGLLLQYPDASSGDRAHSHLGQSHLGQSHGAVQPNNTSRSRTDIDVITQALPYVGSWDQIALVSSSVVSDGPGVGNRVIDVHPMGGIHCRILPDRGLDLGPASYQGFPLDWRSSAGFPNAPTAAGRPWLESFGGGLMVTCGPDNVGPDCTDEGVRYGLHGRHSATPASRVSIDVDSDDQLITIRGQIRHTSVYGPNLLTDRTIKVSLGRPRIEVRDHISNQGFRPEPLMLLYHLNFGYPVVSPDSQVMIDSDGVVPRDAAAAEELSRWADGAEPSTDAPPQVFEHLLKSWPTPGQAMVVNPSFVPTDGIAVRVTFDQRQLPRLWQWRNLAPGMYLAGIEPANCGVRGRDIERGEGLVPELAPGSSSEFGFVVEAVTGQNGIAKMMHETIGEK